MGQPASRNGERQGDFLGGKYLLGDCLGIGGMGEVYRATNVSLGRNVAVKILNKEHTANEDDVLRFLREARAAAAVRHPNVVDVFDVARDDDGTPFIVQELLAGEDLEQYLLGPANGRLAIEEAIEIMIPVADAVGSAHARNVVHRDLKPANIFLAREGAKITPKVLDFGACLYQTVGALSAKERRMLIGTPHYMAPEQITTAQDIDARADVWAMGVILFELCVGETPFEAEDVNQVLKLVRTRPIPKLREVCTRAPVSLEIAVGQCLERDRARRFADATAVKSALEKIRDELRGEARKRIDTPKEMPEVAPPSARMPSLALKARPTTRRGASLLTLSGPEDDSVWDGERGPKSASRPIADAKAKSEPSAKPARARPPTAQFEPGEASLELDDPAPLPSLPPAPSPAPPAARVPSVPAPPPSRPAAPGEPRNLAFDSSPDAADLDLDLEPPPSRQSGRPKASSIPPVLDPRAASRKSDGGAAKQTGPGRHSDPSELRVSKPDSGAHAAGASLAVSPPPLGAPPSMRGPPAVVPAGGADRASRQQGPWPTSTRLAFAATIALPALVAFVVLQFLPAALAPLAHAMRGESPLASGALAVVTLVGAAALTMGAFASEPRSKGLFVASGAAIVLGIVMIIVTFSASETAELGMPPSAAGVVPFIAPIVPLGMFVFAVARARQVWLSKYERREAVMFTALASVLVLAALELGPAGAVRTAPSPPPPPAAHL